MTTLDLPLRRPLWRRIVLLLVNVLPPGAGFLWIGRYRLGIALLLASSLSPYLIWALPGTRGNEILIGVSFVFIILGSVAVFYLWSTLKMWAASEYVLEPFPQAWHWPYWICLALFVAGTLAIPDRLLKPFRSFYFPSTSMSPTLTTADIAWADMRAPLSLRRGDIVVNVRQQGEFATRVVGLPGDRVAMRDGALILNGKVVQQQRRGSEPLEAAVAGWSSAVRMSEHLPGAAAHDVYDLGATPQDNFPEVRIPAGTVFLLGDNRDNAMDSRFDQALGGAGFVPLEQITGRIFFIYFSNEIDRVGTPVR